MTKKLPENAVDRLYSSNKADLSPFKFTQAVVDVFPDMINRSVPGYQTIVNGIGKMSSRVLKEGSKVYDLGCSLGNVSLSIAKQNLDKSLSIVAIDNSAAMIERCSQHVRAFHYGSKIKVEQGDITQLSLQDCDMVVINFTLQFVSPSLRQGLIDDIFRALKPGGMVVISEKVSINNLPLNELMIDLHHEFKRENGYSDLEISQKRSALESVMKLDSFDTHKQRLISAGFPSASIWFQHFNFLSFCGIKP